ncbi:MAG: trypsin-like peptidase domain-containing protein [Armatimonadota bacterium]|jgi:hypothetical protein
MKLCLMAGAGCVIVLMALGAACDPRRATVASGPGETTEELGAAAAVLAAVGGSVPLVEVRVSGESGTEQRRTVGVVVGDDGQVLVDAASLSLSLGEGDGGRIAHARSIEAVFHPGGERERRYVATVMRESSESELALLSVKTGDAPAVRAGDDVADGTAVFAVTAPLNLSRLVAEAGIVRTYEDTESGRRLIHTAGRTSDARGPVFNAAGDLLGLHVGSIARGAIPAVEIVRWLETPDPGELSASDPGQVANRLLTQMDARHRFSQADDGYIVPRSDGPDLLVRQSGGVISVQTGLGRLLIGDAIEALRSNYSDPMGAIALRPTGDEESLTWIARLPTDVATAAYLSDVTRIAALQAERWRRLQSGHQPDYPYDYYPGGDEAAHRSRLAEVIRDSALEHEATGEGHRLQPSAEVPIFAGVFHGMAYIYAYSGGMPGATETEQDQVARRLLRRNWDLPLGRLSLDRHSDLTWEAQVPIEYLTPEYVRRLVAVGEQEIARLKGEFGQVPFNEQ